MSELDADYGSEAVESVQNSDEPMDLNEIEEIPGEEEGQEATAPEAEEEAAQELLATIEHDGESWEVPEKLKEAFMFNKDYTQKTQDLATQRKELEAQREQANQQAEATEDYIQQKATLFNIQAQIEQYEQVDWQAANAEDPVGAQQAWMNLQQLKEAKAEAEAGVSQFEQERSATMQQEAAGRFQEAENWAQQNIPNWSNERGLELVEFASKEVGLSQEQMRQFMSPQFVQVMHLAKLGQAAMQRGNKPPQPAPKPLKKVTAKASPNTAKSEADMDMDEYVAHRQKQMGR
jgi:hypothetical protein